MEKETKTIVVNSWTDPITGKFKEGNPGGGRPLGTKNFSTDFDEVIVEIAKLNKITTSEARKILLKKAFSEAKRGNFPFYKDICDRYYGKPGDNTDITSGGERIGLFNYYDKTGRANQRDYKDKGTNETN